MYDSPFPALFCLRARVASLIALVCLWCAFAPLRAAAQPGMPTGANYTDDMPSVAKVESVIQGSDAADTAARQVNVFDELVQYINRVQTNRNVRAGYTPAEAKLVGDYYAESTRIKQDFPKTHTAAEVAAFNQDQGKYVMDDTFWKEWPKQLIGAQANAAIQNANAGLQASAQRMYNQQMQDLQQAQQAQQQAASQQVGMVNGQAMPMSNDPTAVGIRRCLELGGSTGACMGGGLINGMIGLATGGQGMEGLTGPGRAGVVLSGGYESKQPGASLNFSGDIASIGSCGKLVPYDSKYTLTKTAGSLKVTLPASPATVTLTMRPDGSLQGPGAITLNGQVVVGTHYETITRTGNCAPNCVTTTATPIYGPATDRCTLGTLDAPPPAPPQSANNSAVPQMGGMMGGIMDTLVGAMSATMTGSATLVNSLPGLRMQGKYTSSGLQLDFAGDAVTIDCGQAHVKSPYTVENATAALMVHVQNPGGPFDLVVSSDNSLRGSGSTTINGRLVSGMNGTDITFTPHSETCQIGTYAPQMGSGATTTVAANASPAPVAAVPAKAATAAAATVSAATASTGSMTLAITSSFPIAKNPLAGAVVKLMTDRFDNVLRKAGAPVPAGTTPGQALAAYVQACPPPTGCPAAAQLMKQYYVGTATFDGNGGATISAAVPPGSYYVICSASGTTGALVWDLPVNLKAGQNNSILLTATNAELLK
ncbi:MAG TPA: hypothetical protein VG714_01955 [Acidobacteriaceae bacterium]|nr:hypothetical protein [Acidobacteriaceae bacterium]